MNRKTAKLLMVIDGLVFIFAALAFQDDSTLVFLIGLALLVVFMILRTFLRCPSCGRGPGRDWLFTEFCPYCGEPLDD